MAVNMAGESQPGSAPPTLRKRRLIIGANVFLQAALLLLLAVMINWLASRYYVRFDWTRSAYYKVSEKTKKLLTSLQEPVKVIVFLQLQSERGPAQKVSEDVNNLLKEFQYFGKDKLQIEHVDPYRDLARARQVVEEYNIDVMREPALVIFASGPRHKYVSLDDMVEFNHDMYGRVQGVKSFKGEGAFLSAIQTVIEEKPPKVYFLAGHGERDPDSVDDRAGYSMLAGYVKRDNVVVEKWNLQAQQALPSDADLLVIAGPTAPYTDAEISILDQWLKNRGRLLVLLEPRRQTRLEPFLQQWGVQADDNLVASKGILLGIASVVNVTAIGEQYAPHPITARLEGVNTEFPYSRSVRRSDRTTAGATDQPRVTELVRTGPNFWGESDYADERFEFDPATDQRGPVSLAVAVEMGGPRGVDVDIGVSRMVVVGGSGFVDNGSLTHGNIVFFMNALNWLLKREQLVAVGPKSPQEFRIDMSPGQVRAVYALVIGGMPLAVALTGLLVWMRRRK
jgi:ABC-type uncharacterized transport system involved in gliding motility auxiliary subunit